MVTISGMQTKRSAKHQIHMSPWTSTIYFSQALQKEKHLYRTKNLTGIRSIFIRTWFHNSGSVHEHTMHTMCRVEKLVPQIIQKQKLRGVQNKFLVGPTLPNSRYLYSSCWMRFCFSACGVSSSRDCMGPIKRVTHQDKTLNNNFANSGSDNGLFDNPMSKWKQKLLPNPPKLDLKWFTFSPTQTFTRENPGSEFSSSLSMYDTASFMHKEVIVKAILAKSPFFKWNF